MTGRASRIESTWIKAQQSAEKEARTWAVQQGEGGSPFRRRARWITLSTQLEAEGSKPKPQILGSITVPARKIAKFSLPVRANSKGNHHRNKTKQRKTTTTAATTTTTTNSVSLVRCFSDTGVH